MADVINNPPPAGGDAGSGMGLIIGVVVILLIVVLFFMFAVPAFRGSSTQVPSQGGDANSGIDVNIPDNVDLNVSTQAP